MAVSIALRRRYLLNVDLSSTYRFLYGIVSIALRRRYLLNFLHDVAKGKEEIVCFNRPKAKVPFKQAIDTMTDEEKAAVLFQSP